MCDVRVFLVGRCYDLHKVYIFVCYISIYMDIYIYGMCILYGKMR